MQNTIQFSKCFQIKCKTNQNMNMAMRLSLIIHNSIKSNIRAIGEVVITDKWKIIHILHGLKTQLLSNIIKHHKRIYIIKDTTKRSSLARQFSPKAIYQSMVAVWL